MCSCSRGCFTDGDAVLCSSLRGRCADGDAVLCSCLRACWADADAVLCSCLRAFCADIESAPYSAFVGVTPTLIRRCASVAPTEARAVVTRTWCSGGV